MNALPCFVCGKPLAGVGGPTVNQPYYGTAFDSYGHYGSGQWDPLDSGELMELAVCDLCLKARRDRTRVILPQKRK